MEWGPNFASSSRDGGTGGAQDACAPPVFGTDQNIQLDAPLVLKNDYNISSELCFEHDFDAIVHPLILAPSTTPD